MSQGIDASDWSLIEDLFHRALERPEEQRSAWLLLETSNTRVRGEVESLLASHITQNRMPSSGFDTLPAPALPGDRFEDYEPLSLLGRGGMGAVYLARRSDGQFEQKVALKVLASHLAGEEFLRRFQTERQLLASLSHAHITQLHDSGISSSGNPYLVMEYVEGEPLDRYCDTRKLGITERLRLFLQVCEAVDYAHRNLIVHRDLKPSNILVTADGVVKLLDFGTASLIVQDSAFTVTRTRMLTPRYACPERLRGERAHPAHDVFSLGVILYELLVGAWPFGDPSSVLVEMQRAMGASAPAQPAGSITEEAAKCRAQPRDRLKRIVQGDLSAITMKAIEDQPARRYTTVRELSDDVRSFLNGRPVQARQQTAFYRANKFVRRNWVPVAAAAILVAGLSLATALVLRQASVAKEEARKAEKVNQFLNDMLSSAGDFAPDAKNFTVAQMLDASLPKLAISWKNDPAVEASLRMDLGWSYRTLFELDKSKAQFQQALEIYRQRGDQAGTANALAGLGADAASLGLPEEALKHLQSSTEAFEHLGRAAPSPAVVTAKLMLAEFLVLNLNRDFDHAFTLVDEALVLCARDSTVPRASEAYAYFIRGSALSDVGKAGEAETAALKSLDILQKDHNDSLLKGRTLYLLMILNARSRKTVAAAEYARQYYQLNLMRLGANHPSTLDTKIMLARCRADAGIPGEAGQDALDALTMLRKAYPPLSANLWNPINNTSHTLNLTGRFKDAEPLAREELAIMNQDVYPKTDPRRGQSLFELGTALAGEKKYKEAAQVFERSALNYEGSGPTWARRAKEAREQAAVLH